MVYFLKCSEGYWLEAIEAEKAVTRTRKILEAMISSLLVYCVSNCGLCVEEMLQAACGSDSLNGDMHHWLLPVAPKVGTFQSYFWFSGGGRYQRNSAANPNIRYSSALVQFRLHWIWIWFDLHFFVSKLCTKNKNQEVNQNNNPYSEMFKAIEPEEDFLRKGNKFWKTASLLTLVQPLFIHYSV